MGVVTECIPYMFVSPLSSIVRQLANRSLLGDAYDVWALCCVQDVWHLMSSGMYSMCPCAGFGDAGRLVTPVSLHCVSLMKAPHRNVARAWSALHPRLRDDGFLCQLPKPATLSCLLYWS